MLAVDGHADHAAAGLCGKFPGLDVLLRLRHLLLQLLGLTHELLHIGSAAKSAELLMSCHDASPP